jgi:hypothetical protein
MTTNITALARAAGLAGRDWMAWTFDDAVQLYVDEHGSDAGFDSERDAWEAAYADGLMERRRTVEGWIERWTTAPAAYDCFGTMELATEGEWHGRVLRRVLMHPEHATYQSDRYASGLHGTSDRDPREIDREIDCKIAADRAEDARREAARAAATAWLASASESELAVALESDGFPTGASRSDVRAELRRRAEARETQARETEYDRCRALVGAHEALVDDGAPARRSRWGVVPSRPSRVYYGISVDEYPRDASRALVRAQGRDGEVGVLRDVAGRLDEGTLRGARADDVPPEPVLRRIGHDRLADVRRIEVEGRVVWIGRPTFAAKELILDDRGRIVRARAVVAAVEALLLGTP